MIFRKGWHGFRVTDAMRPSFAVPRGDAVVPQSSLYSMGRALSRRQSVLAGSLIFSWLKTGYSSKRVEIAGLVLAALLRPISASVTWMKLCEFSREVDLT